jgi:2-furoate---CoA ligase
MLYTSGTTGRPKGVPRSHRAERSAALAQLVQLELGPGDRTLGVMPLYHTMGMRSLLAASACGGLFCVQSEFRADAALDAVERERLTSLYLAPTLFHDLVAAQRERPRDVSSVRALAYAGAPMAGVLVERCVEAFAPEAFVNHYGSTEIYTFTIHGDQRAKPGCAGRAALNARIRLVAPVEGAAPSDVVPPGEVGQVACALSSDEAFGGYWNRPDADARQIRDGWYFPGDLGQLDADGDLYLVGRIDDMIVSGGENVHPLEIEEWLVRHPGVDEAAVVGEEDERLGQRVVAYVVCAGAVTADVLDAHCLASPTLARFKRPRDYRFVDALPKSASGKLLRRLLRTTEETT